MTEIAELEEIFKTVGLICRWTVTVEQGSEPWTGHVLKRTMWMTHSLAIGDRVGLVARHFACVGEAILA